MAVEVVLCLKNKAGITLKQLAIGWVELQLFTQGRTILDLNDPAAEVQAPTDMHLNAGSVRMLAGSRRPAAAVAIVPHSAMLYHFYRHTGLKIAKGLVADGEVFQLPDAVPGTSYQTYGSSQTTLGFPHISSQLHERLALNLRGIRIYLPPNYERTLLLMLACNVSVYVSDTTFP
jgi:hypothetical protein